MFPHSMRQGLVSAPQLLSGPSSLAFWNMRQPQPQGKETRERVWASPGRTLPLPLILRWPRSQLGEVEMEGAG